MNNLKNNNTQCSPYLFPTIQMLSTLPFGVLYSSLGLILVTSFNLAEDKAASYVATFAALAYCYHFIGGQLVNRFFSMKWLMNMSLLFQAIGCALLVIDTVSSMYWALAIFVVGSGILVVTVNNSVTSIFSGQKKKREYIFFVLYSFMNIGFICGFYLAGYAQAYGNYHWLFSLCVLTTLLAIFLIAYFKPYRQESHVKLSNKGEGLWLSILLVIFVCFAVLNFYLFKHPATTDNLLLVLSCLAYLIIIYYAVSSRNPNILRFFIYSLISLIFWALYYIGPVALVFFNQHNVNRNVFNFTVPIQWLQMVNTITIIIGGPLLAKLFNSLREREILTLKTSSLLCNALLLIGMSYLFLYLSTLLVGNSGLVNISWVIVAYFTKSLGELLMAPIGFNMIGEIIPENLRNNFMGIWMMVNSSAAIISQYLSTTILAHSTQTVYETTTTVYRPLFLNLGVATLIGFIVFAIILFVFNRKLSQ